MLKDKKKKHILWFRDITNKDVALVGGKNASLGEMYSELTSKGVNIPNGFAITAEAYKYFTEEAGINDEIKKILTGVKKNNVIDLTKKAQIIRGLIANSKMPADLELKILNAYHKFGRAEDVAVRSSATAEDLPDASFAGQQETYLNVVGKEELLKSVKDCFASLFTARAIAYREEKGFDHFTVYLSVTVQKMVRSDLASSGVMFSIDTESGFENAILINSIYGLGENIVQGKVNPDEFYVFKPTLGKAKNPILSRRLGDKRIKMIYERNDVKDVAVSKKDQTVFSVSDQEVLKLAKWAVLIEKHYDKPMDMEWAKDGRTGKLFIVQARPETVQSQRDLSVIEEYNFVNKKDTQRSELLVEGRSVGSKIGHGKAHVINDVKDISKFKDGEVLITEMTDPDWVPVMKKAAAIVTNSGGRTCHAAIVSRELGIPCVVGTNNVTEKIKTNEKVTVSCAEGETGKIYAGLLDYRIDRTNLKNLKRPKTKIMMNVGEPEQAFEFSFIPNDGVGLAREEFIVNSYIKIHPRALFDFDKLTDKKVKKQIEQLTVGYEKKTDFFVDKLIEGIARIGAAFYPKDVIVRLSDFKSDEYANLIGGHDYEPVEDNPMIGWRGASRYYDPKFIDIFKLECKALKKVREEIGLKNIKIMIPFVRTVEEAKKVIKIMEQAGLKRHKDGLEIYMMVEIPANIILAEEFAKLFDGFSIGSNDLTQLTLGLDRNSGIIAHVGDERNEAVKMLISQVIKIAKKTKTKIGICGQGPSDFPDFAEFLAKEGIDSISLIPDSVIKTTVMISEMENKKKGSQSKKK
jgi:pyruvate, water dikinase